MLPDIIGLELWMEKPRLRRGVSGKEVQEAVPSCLAATEPGKSLSRGAETCHNNVSQRAELKKPWEQLSEEVPAGVVVSKARAGLEHRATPLPPETVLVYPGRKRDAEKHHAGGLSEKQ